jgi:hypothetical protein
MRDRNKSERRPHPYAKTWNAETPVGRFVRLPLRFPLLTLPHAQGGEMWSVSPKVDSIAVKRLK